MPLASPQYVPKYRRVARHIRDLVKNDGLRPGDQLPTERELARRLGVAYLTVRRANQELVEAGIIRREQGRGSFLNEQRRVTKVKTIGFVAVGVEMAAATLTHFRFLQQMLAPHGVRLVFETVMPHTDADAVPPSLREMDAVVVYGALDEQYLRRLAEEKIPVIVSSDCPPAPSLTVVHSNYFRLGYELTRVVAQNLGYDYVWLAIEPLNLFYSRQIVAGYKQAVRDSGLKTESLSLLENDYDPSPFARSLAHARSLESARHAVIWMVAGGFPSISNCGPQPRAAELGVVRHGAQPRWNLPAEFDLGHIPHQSELFARATADVVRQIVCDGRRELLDVSLEPTVRVEQTAQGPRVACDWNYAMNAPETTGFGRQIQVRESSR